MSNLFEFIKEEVPVFSQSRDSIWLDPHIAQQMLMAHLDIKGDGATRNLAFVEASLQWLKKKFPVKQFTKVLDLGCGPGIYSQRLAEAGYQVTGIDFSANSIAYAQKKAAEKNLLIDYQVGNYLQTNFSKENYQLVLLIYCDFGVLAPESRKKLLKQVYESLADGGQFIFDVFTSEKYQNFVPTKTWSIEEDNFWTVESCLHLEANKRYPDKQTYLAQHYLLYPDHHKEFFIWESVFNQQQIKAALSEAGFSQIEIYSDIRGEKLKQHSETMCFVAKK
ncbi:class I SAM-dependent methyltransferase [Enterococcus alishanensis]|uniref:class I SAM-dependent methyltransferase n=1 Tax=Enterococcus alishanensis TaxID=1303817 RepID=UPI001FE646C1|nr:class I SAM-dependent methyltransferase [Enterococcus alishanensis]